MNLGLNDCRIFLEYAKIGSMFLRHTSLWENILCTNTGIIDEEVGDESLRPEYWILFNHFSCHRRDCAIYCHPRW